MPFAKPAKSPANTPAAPRLATQQSFDAVEMAEESQADVGAQLSQATQFGHSLASLQPIQRQATLEEDEELPMKPQLQRETMPEEEEELQMKPQLQREVLPEEEELQTKAIQPKLTIGQPGDKYEQEADSMAAKVMSTPDSAVQRETMPEEDEELQAKPQLQCEAIPEEEDETLQVKPQTSNLKPQTSNLPSLQAKGEAPTVPANFDRQLAQHNGSGQHLSDDTRAFMEPRFGADFSNVRVHETPNLANAIQAQAFTHGQDIYFNAGKYNPGSSGGKKLLAHELTHVVQQNGHVKEHLAQYTVQRRCSHCEEKHVNLQRRKKGFPNQRLSFLNEGVSAVSEPIVQSKGDSSNRLIMRGVVHPDVRRAQEKLNFFHNSKVKLDQPGLPGAPLAEDSVFGAKTYSATLAFQEQVFPRERGKHNGIIGNLTWEKLNNVVGRPEPEVINVTDSENIDIFKIPRLRIWFKAFIPGSISGLTQKVPGGSHKGETMIPGPLPISDCFLTDNRSWSSSVMANSRMTSLLELDVGGKKPVIIDESHWCDLTHEIDCEDGDVECSERGDSSDMNFKNLRGNNSNKVLIDLEASANNPCFTGSPAIDYFGTISIDTKKRILSFEGAVDGFPDYEMYVNGFPVFKKPHPAGNTPADLFGGAIRRAHGSAPI